MYYEDPFELVCGDLEAESDASGHIKLVKEVIVADAPATTPERVTPISTIGSGDVSGRVFELTAHAKVPTEVVFRSTARRKSKTGCAADTGPVGREGACSEADED